MLGGVGVSLPSSGCCGEWGRGSGLGTVPGYSAPSLSQQDKT